MKHKDGKKHLLRAITPYLYILPAIIPLIVFLYWPLLFNGVLSFMKWDLISPVRRFVGWDNYVAFWERDASVLALVNTGKYVLGLLPLAIVIPLVLSVVVNSIKNVFLKKTYEALLFVPTVLSFSVACFVWIQMFTPFDGILARISSSVGLPVISWLADRKYALWAIVIVSGWRLLGYHQLLLGSSLKAVPVEYVEAAKIDGANAWQTFWKIKWPLISPTVFFLLVTTTIFVSDYVFMPIHILTQGGPYNTSTNLIYLVYQYAFRFFNVGLASAAAMITFILFLIVTLVLFHVGERRVHYGD